MKKSHWVWKPASILVCVVSAGGLLLGLTQPTVAYYAVSSALAFASLGTVQFAFGWPRFPRRAWRIFGPLFSVAMMWPLAETVGWLATRLAIRKLSHADQLVTGSTLVALIGFTLAIVVPLYRLGDWANSHARRDSDALTELSDTFA